MGPWLRRFFERATRLPAWLQLVCIWAVLYLPRLDYISFRGEEGRRAMLAMDILANGHWLLPQALGEDYFNKPPFLPWLIAAAGWLLGRVDEWAVRLPISLSILLGGFAVYLLLRPRMEERFATFGGLAFLLTPQVLEKSRLAVTDLPVTALAFSAFVCWWLAFEKGRVPIGRWLLFGVLLACAALTKGPIPIAFVVCAAFAMTVRARRWGELAALGLALLIPAVVLGGWVTAAWGPGRAENWTEEMARTAGSSITMLGYLGHLFGRVLPGVILGVIPWIVFAAACAVPALRRRYCVDRELALALALYVLILAPVILFWPDSRARYMLPAAPAIVAGAFLVIAPRWRESRLMRITVTGFIGVLAAVAIGWWALNDIHGENLTANRKVGLDMRARIEASPAPVYGFRPRHIFYDIAAYLGLSVNHIRPIDESQLRRLEAPAWVVIGERGFQRLDRLRGFPAARLAYQGKGRRGHPWYLYHWTP